MVIKKKLIKKESGISQDTKTILVVLTLLLAYPVGIILMYMWMNWPVWLKLLISTPIILVVLMFSFLVGIMFTGSSRQTDIWQCTKECGSRSGLCYQMCLKEGRWK